MSSQNLFEAAPEVLLSPLTWRLYGEEIEGIISRHNNTCQAMGEDDARSNERWRGLLHLKRRSEALRFKPACREVASSPQRHQMAEIQVRLGDGSGGKCAYVK